MAPAAQGPTGNVYDKYETTNPVERRMMGGFLAALDRMLDRVDAQCPPRTVVEVGAGEGRITERLRTRFPDAAVIGLDLLDETMADGWHQLDTAMMFGDATALPFRTDGADLVVALEVFEHVPQPERMLAEVARVCDAVLVASVPREPIWRAGNLARGRYIGDLGNTPGHVNHWSSGAFRDFVGGAFDVDEVARPLPWTMLRAHVRGSSAANDRRRCS